MTSNIKIFSLLTALCLPACAVEDDGVDEPQGGGGKADDVDDLECAPDEELRLELVGVDKDESSDGDRLTNSVTATCMNDRGFEDAACCADVGLFDAYAAATSCPERVEISKPRGGASLQRCRDSATGSFVDSACCSDVCDSAATRDGSGQCIDSRGSFEDDICCFLAASLQANACEGAAWTTITIEGEERSACRSEKTGRFAMNSCCAAECVAAVSAGELSADETPEACAAKVSLTAPEVECPDSSRENAAGICHNPKNGQFVKAACCEARGSVAVVCEFDAVPAFGDFEAMETEDGASIDPSHQLHDALGVEFESLTADGLDVVRRQQLEATALHLGFLLPGQEKDTDALFEVPDSDGYFFASGEVGGVEIDWIRFFAGDTEVGAVFEKGTTLLLAEIGDGDILGCETAR